MGRDIAIFVMTVVLGILTGMILAESSQQSPKPYVAVEVAGVKSTKTCTPMIDGKQVVFKYNTEV